MADSEQKMRIESGHPVTADVAPVEGTSVRFVVGHRTLLEVSIGRDGRSIEVRGIETSKINGVLYDSTIIVEPCAANAIAIRNRQYGE